MTEQRQAFCFSKQFDLLKKLAGALTVPAFPLIKNQTLELLIETNFFFVKKLPIIEMNINMC